MRHLSLISLVLLTACDGYQTVDLDSSMERGQPERFTDGEGVDSGPITEAPIESSPGREPVGRVNSAKIDATCLDEECRELLYSGAESTGADTFEWTVNGEIWSNEAEIVVTLEEEDLVEVTLTVGDFRGEDTAYMAAHSTGSVTLPDEGPPVAVPGVFPTVVVGVHSCRDPIVVVSVGGCLTSPAPVQHNVGMRVNGGNLQQGDFTFDKNSAFGTVTDDGVSEAAVWKFGNFVNATTYYHRMVPQQYGANQLYIPAVGPAQAHISSMYNMGPLGSITVRSSHLAYQGSQYSTSGSSITVDCASGVPMFSVGAYNPNVSDD
ncbi:MAG: hypothetical protein GWP91_08455 [Rhodobacterales bacterium]|nr:hypothetical protein [Rhodobacterales bacterium]